MDRVGEFRTHIFSSRIVYHDLPELRPTQERRLNQPSLQSRSKVAPKSLQSRTILSLVRHMSGAAFGTGLGLCLAIKHLSMLSRRGGIF